MNRFFGTRRDVFIFSVLVVLLLAIWIIALKYNALLPGQIPTHFNSNGQPNGYGSKVVLFIFPVLAPILALMLWVLSCFPDKFNYPVKVNQEKKLRIYERGKLIVRLVALFVVAFFLLIELLICMGAANQSIPVGWLFGIIVLPMVVPIIILFSFNRNI
jgi:uncharacterized membrane protein